MFKAGTPAFFYFCKKECVMKVSISYKEIWLVAYPIILGSIAQNILNITDTAFLGRVGQVALGAGVLGGLFYHVLLMLGWGMALGGQIIIARRVGEGAHGAVGRVVEHLLYSLTTIAFLLIAALAWLHPHLMSIAVESEQVRQAANSYFGIRIYGLLFAFVTYSMNAFLIGIARTKVITLTSFISVIINIILDYGLIFGKLGFPEMGIRGAATASVIAELVGCAFLMIYISRTDSGQYNLFRFVKPSRKLFYRIWDVSWPLMFQFFLSIFVWFIFFLFIEKMGETELAVSNIVRSIYIVLMIPIWGFASATNTFVSQQIGKGKSDIVIPLVLKIMRLTLVAVAVMSVLSLVFGGWVTRIYTNDSTLIAMTLPVLKVITFASLAMTTAFISFNGVSGTGNTKVSFVIEVVTLMVYLGWAYLMAIVLERSLSWVWFAEIIYGTLVTLLSLLYLKTGRWKNRVV